MCVYLSLTLVVTPAMALSRGRVVGYSVAVVVPFCFLPVLIWVNVSEVVVVGVLAAVFALWILMIILCSVWSRCVDETAMDVGYGPFINQSGEVAGSVMRPDRWHESEGVSFFRCSRVRANQGIN